MSGLVCPTCGTHIDTDERCPVGGGMRCMELAGHEGFHWTDTGRGDGGVLVFFGPYRKHTCAGRLSLREWCVKPPGHEGAHNNGRGTTFSDVLAIGPEGQ